MWDMKLYSDRQLFLQALWLYFISCPCLLNVDTLFLVLLLQTARCRVSCTSFVKGATP